MFVPSLLSGAAFGRLLGHLLHKLDNTRGTFADSGTYALMGAAAICGGIARMTISLTVMILEATGDMQYVLPLMLTVMCARLVGNIFGEGLYDIHIHSRNLYFLEEDEGLSNHVELHDLTVREIMTKRPICLRPVVRVGEVFDMLTKVQHHCFPIGKSEMKILC
jgi:chloride channel 7